MIFFSLFYSPCVESSCYLVVRINFKLPIFLFSIAVTLFFWHCMHFVGGSCIHFILVKKGFKFFFFFFILGLKWQTWAQSYCIIKLRVSIKLFFFFLKGVNVFCSQQNWASAKSVTDVQRKYSMSLKKHVLCNTPILPAGGVKGLPIGLLPCNVGIMINSAMLLWRKHQYRVSERLQSTLWKLILSSSLFWLPLTDMQNCAFWRYATPAAPVRTTRGGHILSWSLHSAFVHGHKRPHIEKAKGAYLIDLLYTEWNSSSRSFLTFGWLWLCR